MSWKKLYNEQEIYYDQENFIRAGDEKYLLKVDVTMQYRITVIITNVNYHIRMTVD